MQEPIAVDSRIQDSKFGKRLVGLKSTGQFIWPAAVHVSLTRCTVRDATSECDDGGSGRPGSSSLYFDSAKEGPGCHFRWSIQGPRAKEIPSGLVIRL